MRLRLVILLAATTALAACTQNSKPTPVTDDEKSLYALGALFARTIGVENFDLTDKEWEMVKAGMVDGSRKAMSLTDEEVEAFIPKLQELQRTRMTARLERDKEAGAAYVDKAAAEEGAQKTPSGMAYKIVEEGSGASPAPTDTVKVHYTGKFMDGKVFDSSHDHVPPDPAEFPLDGVIPCWTEGVQHMKVGGKALLICPSDLAYGDMGQPERGMPGGATLVFDVELLDVVKPADDAAAAAK